MKSQKQWEKEWGFTKEGKAKEIPAIERRARLNELVATKGYDQLDEDEKNEHDALATLVAADEEAATKETTNGNS